MTSPSKPTTFECNRCPKAEEENRGSAPFKIHQRPRRERISVLVRVFDLQMGFMSLEELGAALGIGYSGALPKYTSGLVSRMVGDKMPGGVNQGSSFKGMGIRPASIRWCPLTWYNDGACQMSWV
jgi:hypothetical protein